MCLKVETVILPEKYYYEQHQVNLEEMWQKLKPLAIAASASINFNCTRQG